jgi:hypothetical protein
MPRVEVTCIREFDPPYVRVQIYAGDEVLFGFDVPYDIYDETANALNLPGNPCQGA